MKTTSEPCTVPAGSYFLGDPCYAVPDEHWLALLHSCDFFDASPVGRVAGQEVVALSTAYGDGDYQDQDGGAYSVDAGLIGLTPFAFATKYDAAYLCRRGRIVTFDEPARCYAEGGVLHFGGFAIDTNVADDEDDEE